MDFWRAFIICRRSKLVQVIIEFIHIRYLLGFSVCYSISTFLYHVVNLCVNFFMYRLCIVFLAFSCIGYAMPFILCTTICCCLPCIISVLGFREDFSQNRGATQESINSLPTYKYKIKKNKSSSDKDNSSGEGGIVAAGTEKERPISGEDAVSFIYLDLKLSKLVVGCRFI